jgi:hypothetical protein
MTFCGVLGLGRPAASSSQNTAAVPHPTKGHALQFGRPGMRAASPASPTRHIGDRWFRP